MTQWCKRIALLFLNRFLKQTVRKIRFAEMSQSDFPSLSSARSGTFPTDAFIMQLRNLHTCKCMKIRVLFTRHNATVRMYRFWEHYYTRAMPVLVVMICAETISAGKSLKISNQWDYAFRLFSLPLPSEKCYSGPGYNFWCWMGV